MADYWTPPTWKVGKDLRTTFDSLRKALNDNFDDALSSIQTLLTFKASAEGVWTTYTPPNVGITVGNGVNTAAYKQVGKTVHFWWYLVLGSTTSFAGAIQAGLPATARVTVWQVASAWYLDAGVRHWIGTAPIQPSTTNCYPMHSEAGSQGQVTGAAPFAWGVGDTITISGTYEAA